MYRRKYFYLGRTLSDIYEIGIPRNSWDVAYGFQTRLAFFCGERFESYMPKLALRAGEVVRITINITRVKRGQARFYLGLYRENPSRYGLGTSRKTWDKGEGFTPPYLLKVLSDTFTNAVSDIRLEPGEIIPVKIHAVRA